jgi:hypothetical protein
LHAGFDRVDADLAVPRAIGGASRSRGRGVTRTFAFHSSGDPIDGIVLFNIVIELRMVKQDQIARLLPAHQRQFEYTCNSSNGIAEVTELSAAAVAHAMARFRNFRIFLSSD